MHNFDIFVLEDEITYYPAVKNYPINIATINIANNTLFNVWAILRNVFHLGRTRTSLFDYGNIIPYLLDTPNIKCNMYGLVCHLRPVNKASWYLCVELDEEANRHILSVKE